MRTTRKSARVRPLLRPDMLRRQEDFSLVAWRHRKTSEEGATAVRGKGEDACEMDAEWAQELPPLGVASLFGPLERLAQVEFLVRRLTLLGEWDHITSLCLQRVALTTLVAGPTHPHTMGACVDVMQAYLCREMPAAARIHAERVIDLARDDPAIHVAVETIRSVCALREGDLSRARQLIERALHLRRRCSDVDRTRVGLRIVDRAAADVYSAREEHAKALGFLESDLRRGQELDGSDSELPEVLLRMAWEYYALERYEESISAGQRALDALDAQPQEAWLPTRLYHRLHEESTFLLGVAMLRRHHFEEAEAHLRLVLESVRRREGRYGLRAMDVWCELCNALARSRSFDRACKEFDHLLVAEAIRWGGESVRVGETMKLLGTCHLAAGRVEVALEKWKTALQIFRRRLGIHHTRTTTLAKKISDVESHKDMLLASR